MRKSRRALVFFMIIVSVLVGLTGCGIFGSKKDIDRIIGQWTEIDGSRGFVFYEPESEDAGDAEYHKGNSIYYGNYECHDSSQRIIITVIDNWGSENSMSFNYEIVDDDHINLTQTEDSSKIIELEKNE
ncbi:MAG: hypothetical protein ACLR6S_04495 [Lacrimispora saccharolytica]